MKIETLVKRLNAEHNFTEVFNTLGYAFNPGSILLLPDPTEKQRPWVEKAYSQWIRGGRTIVLIAPYKDNCSYFEKYCSAVAQIKTVSDLIINNERVTKPMIIATYDKIPLKEPDFVVRFD
jgi:hypothetical protein